MGEDAQHHLATLGGGATGGQGGTEPTLVLREDAFCVLALTIEGLRERLVHLLPVRSAWSALSPATGIECDGSLLQAQRLPAEAMIGLCVEAGIGDRTG